MRQRNPSSLMAHLGMATVALIYGVNYFLAKLALAEIHPLAAVALRALTGTLVFWVFHAVAIKEKVKGWKDYLLLALAAVFGISLNQMCFLMGLSKTTEINAGVLMITTPIFVFLISLILGREKIRWYSALGLVIAFAGAFLLIQSNKGGKFSITNESLQGDLFIIMNALSYGIYLIMIKPLINKYNTFTIVKWLFIFGAILNVSIGMPKILETDFTSISGNAFWGLLYLLILTTVVAYFLNAWAMKKVQPSAVSIYIFAQPVIVTILSAFLLDGVVTWKKVLLIAAVILGVFLVSVFQSSPSSKASTDEFESEPADQENQA